MTKIHHLMLLDSSGSMTGVKDVTIEGFNGQLESIRNDAEKHKDQEHFISLVVFGAMGEAVQFKFWKEHIDKAKDLTDKTYAPWGGTPLYDAIGMGMNGLKNEIVDDLKDGNTQVFVTIFTDGGENQSQEFSGSDCAEIIQTLKETEQWTVALLGCDDDDIFKEAEKLNIPKGNTYSYSRGEDGTKEAYKVMSMARTRMSDSLSTGTYTADMSENLMSTDEESE